MSQCPSCGLQIGFHHSILPGCQCWTRGPISYTMPKYDQPCNKCGSYFCTGFCPDLYVKPLIKETPVKYTVELVEENGEIILPIPQEIMESMGWKEGDPLLWIDNKDGTFTLKGSK